MQHFFILILSAIGLSMDAFSMSLIVGMFINKKKDILLITTLVGIFHFIMPLISNEIGKNILKHIIIKPSIISGMIFLLLSLQMFSSIFKKENMNIINNRISYLILSFTVSIDSFSFGIGLSGITSKYILASTIFLIVSSLFTFIGLYFGKRISKYLGKYSIIAGSIILLILSINYILE